jgi:hypothetical protein
MLAAALLILILPQDRAPPFPADDAPLPPARARPCDRRGDEVVVCANWSRAQMDAAAARYAERPIRARRALDGGGSVALAGEQRAVGGVSVPAAMLTLRVPLGRRAKPSASAPPQ